MATLTALHNGITGIIKALEARDGVLTGAQREDVATRGAELIAIYEALDTTSDEAASLITRLNAALVPA